MKKYTLENIPHLLSQEKYPFGTKELFDALEERPEKQLIIDAFLEGKVVIFEYSQNTARAYGKKLPGRAYGLAKMVIDEDANPRQIVASSCFGNTKFSFALQLDDTKKQVLFYVIGIESNRVYSQEEASWLYHVYRDRSEEYLGGQTSFPPPQSKFCHAPDLAQISYGRTGFEADLYTFFNEKYPIAELSDGNTERENMLVKCSALTRQFLASEIVAYAPDIIIGQNIGEALQRRAQNKADFILKRGEGIRAK